MRPLNCREVRDIDRRAIEDYGLPGLVLMENAGRNAAALLESLQIAGQIAIVCGKGNNAGDGLVMARHLQNRGHDVRVLLAAEMADYQGDAAINLQVVQRSRIPLVCLASAARDAWRRELDPAAWIVDAILGTGATQKVRQPFVSVIEAINGMGKKVFAVDIPSGLDCDTGEPLGTCVRATVTGTFVSRKIGFDVQGAGFWTGKVHVLDIGVPRKLLQDVENASRPASSCC